LPFLPLSAWMIFFSFFATNETILRCSNGFWFVKPPYLSKQSTETLIVINTNVRYHRRDNRLSIFAVSVSFKSLRVSLSVFTGTTRSEGRWHSNQAPLLRFDGPSSSIWRFERFDGLSEKYSWIFVASFWLKAILETSRVSILPLGTLQINPKFRNHCSVHFGRCWFLMCWSESRLFKISRHILRFPIFCISRGVRQGLIFRFELMSCRSLQGLRWADVLRLSEANHHGGKLVDKMTLDCQLSAALPWKISLVWAYHWDFRHRKNWVLWKRGLLVSCFYSF